MTKIDVLDSAVKIGLGALIGAIGAIVIAVINSKATTQRDKRQRRIDTLEKCVGRFEEASTVFINLFAMYHGYISLLLPALLKKDMDPAEKLAVEKVSHERWNDIRTTMRTQVTESLHKLHQIDAQLHLIGAIEASRTATDYRIAVTEMQAAIVQPGDPERKIPSVQEWQSYGDKSATLRETLFNQLREYFDSL